MSARMTVNEAVCLIALLGAASAQGIAFLPPVFTLADQPEPKKMAAADFNHDGNLDIALSTKGPFPTEPEGASIVVALGDGAGGFPDVISLFTTTSFWGVTAADFNGDGNPDVAFSGTQNGVSYMLGNGIGEFGPRIIVQGSTLPTALASADMNLDGIPDLIWGSENLGAIVVALSNGDGTFAAPVSTTAGSILDVNVADMNLDGIPDVVGGTRQNGIQVFLGDGAGNLTFVDFVSGDSSFVQGMGLAIGHLDGDNLPDVAWVGEGTTLSAAFGTGAGTVSFRQTIDGGVFFPKDVTIADYDSDGLDDIVIATFSSAGVYRNTGGGTFAAVQFVGSSSQAVVCDAFDMNGDLLPDLVVTGRNFGESPIVAVHLNFSGTGIPGDINGDGSVDLADLNAVLSQFGGPGSADIDGNGIVDLGDLSVVLFNFGTIA